MRWCRRSKGFVLAAFVAAGGAAALPGPGAAFRDVSLKTQTLELPSGMRIVIEEDHSQPLVAIVAVVDVGSAQDPEGKEGLAHLVEHLTFRAKPDGKSQRSTLLNFAGSGYWNAHTTHDLTTYETFGPREALPQLLAVEGNRLLSPLAGLDERAFEVERGVVRNEINHGDEQGAVSAVATQLYGTLYPKGHPYHRPVIGTEASVSALTLADASSFVREHYLSRNVTFYLSGDVDIASIAKTLDASFPHEFLDPPASGPVAAVRRLDERAPPVPPLPPATQLVTIHAPAERPTLYIAWSLPGGYGPQRYLERFVQAAFSDASTRAATAGSDIAGIVTSLNVGRSGNTLVCRVLLKEGQDPARSLERVLDQVVRIWQPTGNTGSVVTLDQQFGKMQQLAIVDALLQAESVTTRAVDEAISIHWTGDSRAWAKDRRGLVDVNRGRLEAFAYEWLGRDRARAVFVAPSGERPFASAETPAVFSAPDDVRVEVAPEALRTYVHGPVGDVRSFVLKNGLEVLLVQRTSAPTVAVTLGMRGGRATSNPLGAAELASFLASPREKANGPPSKYGAHLRLFPSADSTYYTGQAASGNLENLLAMMSDAVKSLHIETTWAGGELVKAYRREDARPSVQAERTFQEQIFPGSPLGRSVTAADVDRLGPGDVQAWIDQSFRPRNAVMAVVGDIGLVEADKQIRDWFEGWQGEQDPRAEAKPTNTSQAEGPVRVTRIDRPGVLQTDIRVGCSVAAQSPTDRIALRLLAARIRQRLWHLARSTLGGSYGFSDRVSFHRQASSLLVEGAVDDRTLTRVLAVARKELDELGTLRLAPVELEWLKWRQGVNSNLQYTTNDQLARALVSARLGGLSPDFLTGYPERLAAVTAEEVSRVAAECRKTAVLLLTGDPAVVAKAVQATAR